MTAFSEPATQDCDALLTDFLDVDTDITWHVFALYKFLLFDQALLFVPLEGPET